MNPITRRALGPAMLFGLPAIAAATVKTPPPKKCECNCKDGKPGPKGDTGPAGPKGDKGDKGDPGICNCPKPTLISAHVDYELKAMGVPIPLPDLTIPTPGPKISNELWYFKSLNACVFFDYNAPTPQYIAFYRGGELKNWDRITPLGDRLWNWIAHNPTTGAAHSCIVSLDKILSKPSRIIQDWTSIASGITFGSFPKLD